MRNELVVDSFAGPGGWDHGLRLLGYTGRVVGIEWDTDACQTGIAAGHERVQLDVREARALLNGETITGKIDSPPCGGFSVAGKGKGRVDAVAVLGALEHVTDLTDLDNAIADLADVMTDERTTLVLEPLRWALVHRPRWLAWEQVPAVQPLWDSCAVILRAHGYSVDTGVLNAEQFGVPQTRKRAVLVAHRELAVALPTPTHSRYYSRSPGKLDPGVLPWVSMAEALGWDSYDRVEFVGSKRPNAAVRSVGAPAPTIIGGHDTANRHWRCAADDPKSSARRVTVAEASVLQTFPADYPWQGSKTSQYQQVGNAIPPVLAAAVLRQVIN